jgi:hypothetical protein
MRFVLTLFVLLSVINKQCHSNQTLWKNPEIVCELKEKEKPVKRFPETTEAVNAYKMADFGKRMNEKFAKSGMTVKEAKTLYKILFLNNFLTKGSYGMPSGNEIQISVEEYFKRIAILKITETEYEIYYKYASCGTNYDYLKIVIENQKITRTQTIEAWKGTYPC